MMRAIAFKTRCCRRQDPERDPIPERRILAKEQW
jgi:hypothetical protein